MSRLAPLVARYQPASIYAPPGEAPVDDWSPYERTGIYADPCDPGRDYWWPGRPLPSPFWPSAVFEQVRNGLTELLLAGLREITP